MPWLAKNRVKLYTSCLGMKGWNIEEKQLNWFSAKLRQPKLENELNVIKED